MAGVISKASLQISTNASQLTTGLTSAAKTTVDWAKSTGKLVNKALSGSFAGVLGSGLGGGISSALGGITGALLAGAGVGTGWLKETVEKIKELANTGRVAGQLGVMSDELIGLQKNAARFNIDGEDIIKTLSKLQAKTAHGGLPFISQKDLAGKDVIGQLKVIADKYVELKGGGQGAVLAQEALSKSFYKWIPILQGGSKGIDEFTGRMKMLGIAINQADMDKVMEAKKALPKLGEIFEGFKTRMAVAFAPALLEMAKAFEPIIEPLTILLKYATDSMTGYFRVVAELWRTIKEAGKDLLDKFPKLKNIFSDMPNEQDKVIDRLHIMAKAAKYLLDVWKVVNYPTVMAPADLIMGLNPIDEYVKILKNFGNMEAVDKFFERVKRKNPPDKKDPPKPDQPVPYSYSPVNAAVEGSREAVGILAKWQTMGLVDPLLDVNRKKLEVARATFQVMQQMEAELKNLQTFKVQVF